MTYTSVGAGNVSIVIPCYNQGATLLEALASVEQVRNENVIDVIIVDDGSSEAETTKILDELAKTGHCVVSQPHRGLGAARNAGIRLAKGEFILPLDSDDRLRDVYLNEGVSLLRRNPSLGVIYSDAEYFGEKSGRIGDTGIRFVVVDPGKFHRRVCSLPKEAVGRSWRIR